MAGRLIRFSDGILAEVESLDGRVEEMSATNSDKIGASFESIPAVLKRIANPIREAIVGLRQEMSREIQLSEVGVELNLGFEAEGNLFITRATTNASLKLKLCFKVPVDG